MDTETTGTNDSSMSSSIPNEVVSEEVNNQNSSEVQTKNAVEESTSVEQNQNKEEKKEEITTIEEVKSPVEATPEVVNPETTVTPVETTEPENTQKNEDKPVAPTTEIAQKSEEVPVVENTQAEQAPKEEIPVETLTNDLSDLSVNEASNLENVFFLIFFNFLMINFIKFIWKKGKVVRGLTQLNNVEKSTKLMSGDLGSNLIFIYSRTLFLNTIFLGRDFVGNCKK